MPVSTGGKEKVSELDREANALAVFEVLGLREGVAVNAGDAVELHGVTLAVFVATTLEDNDVVVLGDEDIKLADKNDVVV